MLGQFITIEIVFGIERNQLVQKSLLVLSQLNQPGANFGCRILVLSRLHLGQLAGKFGSLGSCFVVLKSDLVLKRFLARQLSTRDQHDRQRSNQAY